MKTPKAQSTASHRERDTNRWVSKEAMTLVCSEPHSQGGRPQGHKGAEWASLPTFLTSPCCHPTVQRGGQLWEGNRISRLGPEPRTLWPSRTTGLTGWTRPLGLSRSAVGIQHHVPQ